MHLFAANSKLSQQIRLAHTDIRIPDFQEERWGNVKDPKAKSRESAPSRQAISYVTALGKFLFSNYFFIKIIVIRHTNSTINFNVY